MDQHPGLINHYRKMAGLSPEEVSNALGKSVSTLYLYEQRGAPSKELFKLVRLFITHNVIRDYETARIFWHSCGSKPFPEPPELRRLFDLKLPIEGTDAVIHPAETISPSPDGEGPPVTSVDDPGSRGSFLEEQTGGSTLSPKRSATTFFRGRRLFLSLCVLGALAVVGFQASRASPLGIFTSATPQPSGVQCLRLVDPAPGQNVRLPVEVRGQPIAAGTGVAVGEEVTASFVMRNTCSHTITLEQLRAGGRMNRSCLHTNDVKWAKSAIPVEFPAVVNLIIGPGESYTYRQSRAFMEPGTYFVEPLKKGRGDPWGGFSPSICTDLLVIR